MSVTETEPTRITLLRHGEPVGGPRFRGSTDDPLSERGWEQMHEAVDTGNHWDVVLASPLRRCADFARMIADGRQLPLHLEPRLQELHYGQWEGKTADQLLREDGERLQAFWADSASTTPPDGETVSALEQRVTDAWLHWIEHLAGQRILLVTHGGVIRALLADILGSSTSQIHRSVAVPYACRSELRLDATPHGLLSCLLSHGSLD